MAFDRAQPGVAGELFFHARSLAAGGLGTRLATAEFATAAYPPVPPRLRRLLAAQPAPPAGWSGMGKITCAGRSRPA